VKNRLHVLRAERRLTQGRLAAALGVSRQTINAIETGKYDPSLTLAFQMAALVGRRIEEIFEPDAVPEPALAGGGPRPETATSA
jgi:putative transcriptional regulator